MAGSHSGREDEERNRSHPSADVSVDDVFDALSDSRRRYVLHHLADQSDDTAGYGGLVEYVIAHSPDLDGEDGDRVRLTLTHTHLPKLADAGLIDHDTRSGTVRYRPSSLVEEIRELVADREPA